MNIEVNLWLVFAAAVASMIVGFLWYSKMVLGKPWMKLKGYTEKSMKEAQRQMGMLYGLSFLAGLVTAYVLSHVIALSMNFYGYEKLQTGITSAVFMWLGFIMPVRLTATIFGDKKWKLFAIDTGYQLAAILAMGIVIGLL